VGAQYLNPVSQLSALEIAEIEEKYWDEEQLKRAYGVGELDIPDEAQDWTNGEHVILLVTEYATSREQDNPDHDTTQFFSHTEARKD
jgi:hypothetical protein